MKQNLHQPTSLRRSNVTTKEMIAHKVTCGLEKVLNAPTLFLLNLMNSRRLAQLLVIQVGHILSYLDCQ